jgi:hypothetical protein
MVCSPSAFRLIFMKRTSALFLCLLAVASADVPKKVPFTQYVRLWTDSPFTSKPLAGSMEPTKSPLDDYALGGVTQVTGGYSVILLDKKKPDEWIRIEPGPAPDFQTISMVWSPTKGEGETVGGPSEYRVLEVIRKEGVPLGTAVRISWRGNEKTLEFDEKILAVKAVAPAKPMNPNARPNQPQMPTPQPVPGGIPNPVRPPRPRVVPPQQTR